MTKKDRRATSVWTLTLYGPFFVFVKRMNDILFHFTDLVLVQLCERRSRRFMHGSFSSL